MRVWHNMDIQFTNRYTKARWPNRPVLWIRHGSEMISTVKEIPLCNGRRIGAHRLVRNTGGMREGMYKTCTRWSNLSSIVNEKSP